MFNVLEYETPSYHRGSTFTVELGKIIESGFNLGMDKYPIFNEDYREFLNNKIYNHFWFREIGLETPALFKKFLNRKMNEIMPFYNQLYNSTLEKFSAFENYDLSNKSNTKSSRDEMRDITRTDNSSAISDSGSSAKANGTSRTVVSNTPQMQLSGHEDYASNLTDTASDNTSETYAKQTDTTNSSSTDNTKASSNDNQDFISQITGISGITKSRALMEFRETFLNIDMLVIGELDELFMGIYSDYMNVL